MNESTNMKHMRERTRLCTVLSLLGESEEAVALATSKLEDAMREFPEGELVMTHGPYDEAVEDYRPTFTDLVAMSWQDSDYGSQYHNTLWMLDRQNSPTNGGESEFVNSLRKEVMQSKMTHNFTLTRDEVGLLLKAWPWYPTNPKMLAGSAVNALVQKLKADRDVWDAISPDFAQKLDSIAVDVAALLILDESEQSIKADAYDMIAEAVEKSGVRVTSIVDYVSHLIAATDRSGEWATNERWQEWLQHAISRWPDAEAALIATSIAMGPPGTITESDIAQAFAVSQKPTKVISGNELRDRLLSTHPKYSSQQQNIKGVDEWMNSEQGRMLSMNGPVWGDSLKERLRVAFRAGQAQQSSVGKVSEHVRKLVGKLSQWHSCMSYNDSYFGEPAGLVKSTVRQLALAVDPIKPKAE